ncbi:MAG TPA: hypothetical protein VLY23_04940 [Candidatus Acidoferrum sp.]|nr:hypothetical protein [Candidatus Acidoferrum sp.]
MCNLKTMRWLAIAAVVVLAACGNSSTSPNSTASNEPSSSSASAPEKAERPAPKPIVIAAGTILTVTVDQAVSSKTSNNGDHFDASLAEPVVVDGREVLRPGTRVSGVVTDAKSAGRFKGNAELGLALDGIDVDGKAYEIQTSTFGESTKGRGKRTGIGAGGGAAFGAIIGAIAGGGKGAAIGAAAGGGAGTAGAAFTGKRDITIPAETKLDFKLAQPLAIPRREN